jgi:hypothetical protein
MQILNRQHAGLRRNLIAAWLPEDGPNGQAIRNRIRSGGTGNFASDVDWSRIDGVQTVETFANSSSYVETENIALANRIDHNSCFSVCLWFRPNSLSSFRNLIIKRKTSSPTAFNVFFNGSTIFASQYDGSNDRNVSKSGFAIGNWYFVTMTSQNGTLRGYSDGELFGTSTRSLAPVANDEPITFGRDPLLGRYIAANFGECLLYNRTLSDTEIAKLYRLGQNKLFATQRRYAVVIPPSFRAAWVRPKNQIIGGGFS